MILLKTIVYISLRFNNLLIQGLMM